jgi:hypothetical protein
MTGWCSPAPQTGGLLSDVFLHLVPHAFMGEHQDPGAHFVMVEEKRNILIGYVFDPESVIPA